MIDREEARSLAQKAVEHGLRIDPVLATETREGWYFPYQASEDMAGSNGVIVHKRTGRALVLGSAFPVERDLQAFDEGFQFAQYDLVVLSIQDRPRTVQALADLRPMVTVPEYRDGTVWRVPRELSKREIDRRLDTLPAVFPAMNLYFKIEVLQEARKRGDFRFEALELRGTPLG
jgi:hypothetical protein